VVVNSARDMSFPLTSRTGRGKVPLKVAQERLLNVKLNQIRKFKLIKLKKKFMDPSIISSCSSTDYEHWEGMPKTSRKKKKPKAMDELDGKSKDPHL